MGLDLPGHGESINLGEFVPGERQMDPIIWEADKYLPAILDYLRSVDGVDPTHIAVVGASYSGYVQAYVVLSPGSFSERSIAAIDTSGVRWLFIAAREDRHLTDITAAIRETSKTAEVLILPGGFHATDMLGERHDLAERVVVWLTLALK